MLEDVVAATIRKLIVEQDGVGGLSDGIAESVQSTSRAQHGDAARFEADLQGVDVFRVVINAEHARRRPQRRPLAFSRRLLARLIQARAACGEHVLHGIQQASIRRCRIGLRDRPG